MLTFNASAACAPASCYRLRTAPTTVHVTNVVCKATGTGTSICAVVNRDTFARQVEAEIARRATTGPSEMSCGAPCEPFQLAEFDKTRTYTGSDVVFLDGTGRVVPTSTGAVSAVNFDWSADVRYFGEVGLCLATDLGPSDPLSFSVQLSASAN